MKKIKNNVSSIKQKMVDKNIIEKQDAYGRAEFADLTYVLLSFIAQKENCSPIHIYELVKENKQEYVSIEDAMIVFMISYFVHDTRNNGISKNLQRVAKTA